MITFHDLLTISKDGVEAIKMNAYINCKTAEKRLQFGSAKCKVMTLGKHNKNRLNTHIKIEHLKKAKHNNPRPLK